MSRLVPLLCLGCLVAIGASIWGMLGSGAADRLQAPKGTAASPGLRTSSPLVQALDAARHECSLPALDEVVQRLQAQTKSAKNDLQAWHVLSAAMLERVQQRSHLRGMKVGEPIWSELPRELSLDVDAGLEAVARARELGDDSGDLFRIEANLTSQRITGLATALQWNGKIQDALAKSSERAQDDPQLHVALGLRKLFAPALLGHDPVRALEHFEFAAQALLDDERPAVFAAMASYLQKKRQQAVGWLEQAVARNPNNAFARVVLQRVRRDEGDPFGRDVTAAEAAASK